ncbi:hypothetical protein LTR54_006703 [Friedmanniomyces endolithicus]|uniref:Piwi domain-containing protein n=1 Tax=Friedmanniomyces endolithicus TaxID=329885 RepID=A0AAN6FHA3_9PEZI|nr:hypothetical protein LTS00_012921 [Friedmanniomyces endolithicus]KAK0317458.1 hypothetical protein LTR82_011496 [Friedmanniomyces endolithicus]KAK1006180.1 hypothetical protein LTR54_006703 [Friedmanniomyces endolithicus]
MGNKKKKQPGNTPAKKATQNTTPDVCIRCPDRETAEKKEHRNDLNKCFNDFPSRQIGDEPATHAIDELWWGFSSGKVSADLDLSQPAFCDELLKYAKTVGKEFQPHPMDIEIEERNKSAGMMAAKRDAKWKLPQEGKVIPISKEMLEAALEAVQSETAKKAAQAEKLKAEKVMRKAGTSVLGQDATAAGSSSKVSADTKGNSSGTGSAAADGKTVSSGGGSGSGKPLRGGPPTTDGIFIQTGSAQEMCPRCPVHSPYHHAHAIAPDGLLDCCGQIQPGIGSTLASNLDKLWPRLRLDRSELGPDQLSSYDAVNDRLHSDPDLAKAKAIVQLLRQGGTQYKSVLLTKGLAEYALLLCHQAEREPATLDESDPEDGDPSTGPPSAPNLTVSTYSNPTHTNELTGVLDQYTDHDRTLGYIRDVAIRMSRNARRDLNKLSKAKLEREVGEVSKSFGLRTSFASKAHDHSKVSTNHLSMRWPKEIHVYAVEMIRTNRSSTAPVTVKKNVDKRMVIEMLKNTHYAHYLNSSGGNDRALKWVTDGDLIWSVVPLFHANDPTNVPRPLLDSGGGGQITYDNEMGVRLTLEEVTISFIKTINMARPMGEMFYDTTTATYDDSDPGLITRGLNAFFSRFASETRGNVSTSANKSFVAMTQRVSLDSNAHQHTLAALKGFFLSVRPGIDSMYLNVNHATSPFFEEILVSEFVTRARQAGRSEGEIRAVLKGVKVRIIYQTVKRFKKEDERYRFITCVGSNVRASDGTMQIRPDIGSVPCRLSINVTPAGRTVYDWYTAPPNSPLRSHEEFPAPPLRSLPRTDWAINVGGPISREDSVRWYPASQLRIAPQQLFRGRLTGSQTTQMLNVAVQTPDPHRISILKQGPNNGMFHLGYAGNSDVRAANPAGGNQSLTEPSRPAGPLHQAFLQAVNMRAEIEMIRIPGRWLSRPTLVHSPRGRYRSLLPSNKPGTASWDLRDRVFATQADFRELAVLDLQACSMQSESRRGFIELLCTQLLAHGLIPPREEREVRVEWQSAPLISKTMDLSTETRLRAQLKSLFDTYACVKRVADLELGIQTICAASGKAVLRWSPQTVSNVCLKYNTKGARGGRDNHHFDGKDLQILRSADEQADTIVIGADVTHPGKGSAIATPLIAAVVGSADDQFMQFPGSMRLQRGSKEDITDRSGMVKERLLEWASRHNKTLPKKVLFYRDGVSESQYDILRRRELPQVQVAMNEAYRHLHPDEQNLPPTGMAAPDHSLTNWKDISRPNRVQREREADEEWAAEMQRQPNNRPFQMTFVVVGKRHNTRFYPTHKSHTLVKLGRNVKPGLVVDEVITHPYSMDFYLQSHEPIKGTGRSAHYFVLQNNMGLTADDLQSITHTFCYAYTRATRGVSYCAPAYYADRLCERGRAYLRYYLINHPAFQPRHRRDQSPNAETHDQYAAAVIASIENDPRLRPQPGPGQTRRMNPWHEDMDDTMFYL